MAAPTMRALVLDGPGPASALQIRELPVPIPIPGSALIAVKAFGLNRSELHSRLGLAEGMAWPRVLGTEATGVIEACPGGEFTPGQQVATLAGGMGRVFDGGYGEYVCVPVEQVVPFTSSLDWPTLGAPRDARDGQWVTARRYRRKSRSDSSRAGRHVIGRDGDRGLGQAARDDGALDDSECRQGPGPRRRRCRPRDHRYRQRGPSGSPALSRRRRQRPGPRSGIHVQKRRGRASTRAGLPLG